MVFVVVCRVSSYELNNTANKLLCMIKKNKKTGYYLFILICMLDEYDRFFFSLSVHIYFEINDFLCYTEWVGKCLTYLNLSGTPKTLYQE